MGKACSKSSTAVNNNGSSRRTSIRTIATNAQDKESQRPGPTPGEDSVSAAVAPTKAEGNIYGAHILTVEERLQPAELVTDTLQRGAGGQRDEAACPENADALDRPKEGKEKRTVSTVEGQDGVAPVAVIRQEKMLMEEGEKGESVMKVSVSEAIICADLPGLPATVEGVSQQNLELLRKAHEHVKAQRKQATGPVAINRTDEEAKPSSASTSQGIVEELLEMKPVETCKVAAGASAYGYLLYSSRTNGGSLFFLWSKEPFHEQAERTGNDEVILLSFVPAPQRLVPKMKFTPQQAKKLLLTEIETQWTVWKKSEKKQYFAAWTHALKIVDDYEAMVTLHEWPTKWPPHPRVALLHVGPAVPHIHRSMDETGTKCASLRPGLPTSLAPFSYAAVVPPDAASFFECAVSPTEKTFVDNADEAGGASLRLTRRGDRAALDQADLVKWLEEDGIVLSPEQKGITLEG